MDESSMNLNMSIMAVTLPRNAEVRYSSHVWTRDSVDDCLALFDLYMKGMVWYTQYAVGTNVWMKVR